MSSDAEFDAEIRLTLDDQATSQMASAADNVNNSLGSMTTRADQVAKEYRNMRKETQVAGREFQIAHRTMFEGARVMHSIGGIARTGVNAFNAWNIAQIRVQTAQKNLTDAQREYQKAVESGDTDKIVKAEEDLADAKKSVADAAMQTNIQMGLLAFDIIPNLISQVPNAIKEIKNLKMELAAMGTMNLATDVASGGAAVDVAAGTAATGALTTKGKLGAAIKKIGNSSIGKYIPPIVAGAATFGYLTEDPEGQKANQQYNPFTYLFNQLYDVAHGGTAGTIQNTYNFYGIDAQGTADKINQLAKNSGAFG